MDFLWEGTESQDSWLGSTSITSTMCVVFRKLEFLGPQFPHLENGRPGFDNEEDSNKSLASEISEDAVKQPDPASGMLCADKAASTGLNSSPEVPAGCRENLCTLCKCIYLSTKKAFGQ